MANKKENIKRIKEAKKQLELIKEDEDVSREISNYALHICRELKGFKNILNRKMEDE